MLAPDLRNRNSFGPKAVRSTPRPRPSCRARLGPVHGARPLKRVIQKELVDPIARKLLEGEFADAEVIVMEDREFKLASSPSVLAAIGAMGHNLLNIEDQERRAHVREALIQKLREVDWSRGKHWEGIAGKFTPKGMFSIGGSKETAYAIFGALNDETSPAYRAVRHTPSAVAA